MFAFENRVMNRESLKRHCEAMCEKFKGVPTSGTYGEHSLVLDLLKQTEWIPVSEPPKSSGVYNVTRKFGDGFEEVMLSDACYFDGKYWHNDNRINYGREYVNDEIVAWMPLPEPCKVKNEIDRDNYCKDCKRSIYGEYKNCDVNIANNGYYPCNGECNCKIQAEIKKE